MEADDFTREPLFYWMKETLSNADQLSYQLNQYEDLVDGCLIHEVYLLIDPEPMYNEIVSGKHNAQQRIWNMNNIIRNIKSFYEDELNQVILTLPDCVVLGSEPNSTEGIENMRSLLLLLLGCAVQCPNQIIFIERMREFPDDHQRDLMPYIEEIMQNHHGLTSRKSVDSVVDDNTSPTPELIKRLIKQRERYFQMWTSLYKENMTNQSTAIQSDLNLSVDKQHHAVELSEWRAKHRKLRQECEEKSECLSEKTEELKKSNELILRLKMEIEELKHEARQGNIFRDEADGLRERAELSYQLENDIERYKSKLVELDYMQNRLNELRDLNDILQESKDDLEERLTKNKQKMDGVAKLQAENSMLKRSQEEFIMQQRINSDKILELEEENRRLRLSSKSSGNFSSLDSDDMMHSDIGSSDNSLADQLSFDANTKLLKLQLENKKLQGTIERLQEDTIQRDNSNVLQLEKDKATLLTRIDDLEFSKEKLRKHAEKIECALKNSEERLSNVEDSLRRSDSMVETKQADIDRLNREKQKLDSEISQLTKKVQVLQHELEARADYTEISEKLVSYEKEVSKLRKANEENENAIDKLAMENENIKKENDRIVKQIKNLDEQCAKLRKLEKASNELERLRDIDHATIADLENDLVKEKMKTQQLNDSFNLIGLPIHQFTDPEEALDRIANSPEVLKAVRERQMDDLNKSLCSVTSSPGSSSVAMKEVAIARLESQNKSLNGQHTALQIANSQLVAEKEEVLKELKNLRHAYELKIADQRELQSIHEQLTAEYESLTSEKEALKSKLSDCRAELSHLQEKQAQLEEKYRRLQDDYLAKEKDTQTLKNLREEHSKLKDDFRSLFASNAKTKEDYKALRIEYTDVRSKARHLNSKLINLQAEHDRLSETNKALETYAQKQDAKFEVLTQMNERSEEDRKTLMQSVSNLMNNYHDLLTNSLDDKDQYHTEAKINASKINNLSRQKEKLEEKIMEHYRKMESASCTSKKRSFGSNMIKKVKKAGAELINKSRKPTSESVSDQKTMAIDSDTSNEDQSSKIDGDCDETLTCLSVPGTRRTLYFSENEDLTRSETIRSSESLEGREDCCIPPNSDIRRSLRMPSNTIVYNRVTTNVGHHEQPTTDNSRPISPTESSSSSRKGKNQVWHEYGCV